MDLTKNLNYPTEAIKKITKPPTSAIQFEFPKHPPTAPSGKYSFTLIFSPITITSPRPQVPNPFLPIFDRLVLSLSHRTHNENGYCKISNESTFVSYLAAVSAAGDFRSTTVCRRGIPISFRVLKFISLGN